MFRTRFVMLTAARTGSNALASALDAHSDIYSDPEIFHPDRVFGNQLDIETPAERDIDPFAFLKRTEQRAAAIKPGAGVFGFKLFLDHNDTVKDQLIGDEGWKKIVLARKNTLDQFISLTIAHKLEHWVTHIAFDKTAKITLDIEAYSRFHARMSKNFAHTRDTLFAHGADWLDLDYETVAGGDYKALLGFLGVNADEAIQPVTAKQNPAATASKVDNADELYRHLSQAGLDAMWVD